MMRSMLQLLLQLLAICFVKSDEFCPSGYTYLPDYGCYLFEDVVNATWHQAYFDCDQKGGFMAEIRDEDHQALMMQELSKRGGNWWIGLTDLDQEGTFVWQHSQLQLLDFTPWAEGYPMGNESRNCVGLDQDHYYFWTDNPCYEARKPVCWTPSLVNRCAVPGAFLVEENNRCYVVTSTYQNYTESKAVCASLGEGVALAEITSQAESDLLKQASVYAYGAYIGLTGNASTGAFDQWDSGEPVIFENWRSSDYPLSYERYDCVTAYVYPDYWYWENLVCSQRYRAVCEWEAI